MKSVPNKKGAKIVVVIAFVDSVKAFITPFFLTGGVFDIRYRGKDSRKNFENNEDAIHELRYYFIQIVPEDKGVSFGFDGRSDIFYLIIRENRIEKGHQHTEAIVGERMVKNSSQMINLASRTDWTYTEIETLISKLKVANCIGIYKSRIKNNPIDIHNRYGGFIGMASYNYYLFNESCPDTIINSWNSKEEG